MSSSTTYDYLLGEQVHKHLLKLKLESPITQIDNDLPFQRIGDAFRDILEVLGLDLDDDSIQGTPDRVAKMYLDEIFYGLNYTMFPKCTVIDNHMRYDEMVLCKSTIKSMCEHHFVPFIGTAHVAYIPKTKVVGLSKINRICDFFSRRPQVQERLTAQIAATLQFILKTQDVAVAIKAQHFCVHLRGVEDEKSETITSKVGGKFFTKPTLRQEFLHFAK